MIIYSPVGGWQHVSAGEVDEWAKKGWFAEGADGFVDLPVKKQAQLVVDEPAAQEQTNEPEYDLAYLREQWAEKYGKPADLRKGHATLRRELGTWLQRKTA